MRACDVTAVPVLAPAGLERRLSGVGQAIPDHPKTFAKAVFRSNYDVGAALFEAEEKGGSHAKRPPAPAAQVLSTITTTANVSTQH